MWITNAKRRRALKVTRQYKTRNQIKVRTKTGCELKLNIDVYEKAGYKLVSSKPSYANESDI